MKERREMIEFNQNVIVPEIVDQKCREAYDIIYKECEHRKKNKRITFKKGMAIALCAAVVSGAFAVPVVASYISRNGFEFISNETYTKDAAEKHDLTPYAAPVNMLAENKVKTADVVLQSVFCDGSNLSASLSLTPKDPELFKDTTGICSNYSITINGDKIKDEYNRSVCYFQCGEDGNYYTVIHYENLDITEGDQLKIKLYSQQGENGYYMIGNVAADDSVSYAPDKTIAFNDIYEFEYTLKPDTSHNKTYDLNETQGNVTLEKLTVTPFMTAVYISGLDSMQTLKISDQNGDEFEWIDSGDEYLTFTSPYKTSEKIIIDILRLDQDEFPVEYSFEVPIDEGFADKYTVEYNNSYFDQSKVVYDPPFEELEAEHFERLKNEFDKMKAQAKPLSAGEKISVNEFGNINGKYDVTITGYEAIPVDDDVISEYNLDSDQGINGIEIYKNECGDLDDAVFMLITCEIENTHGCSIEPCIPGIHLLSKEFGSKKIPKYYDSFYEYAYVSYKENYGKNSLYYNFEPHEKKTITFGYVVPDYCEEAGYWAYFYTNGDSGDLNFSTVTKGEAALCELK